MNFGKWIIVAFILFGGFIGTLVFICIRQDVNLVSKDYYQEELKYGDQITRLDNTAALEVKPVLKVVGHQVLIQFNQVDSVENGELKLFCPSNPEKDRNYKLQSSREKIHRVNLESFQKGMYRARLYWTMNGKEFYQEEVIYI